MTQYEEDKVFDEWIDRHDFEYGLDHEALMREWDKYKQRHYENRN